ncbi:MAG: UDP-N-acetylmuramate dehydrogenase [Planctomycetota bacterium]
MTSSTTWPCASLADAPLAERTTLRVGGRVEWLLEPRDPEELQAAITAVRERGLRLRILGGGANVVIDDGVLPGVIVTTDRMRRIFRPGQVQGDDMFDPELPSGAMALDAASDDPRLVCWAGAPLPALCRAARDLALSGLEKMAGVPGQVGGGIAMNAGGQGWQMWDVVERVRLIDAAGEFRDIERADWQPEYRDAKLGELIVASAVLRFTPRPKAEVQAAVRDYLRAKNAVQPVSAWSAGCVFKNPDPERSGGRSAGQLIDQAGGKGRRRGGAVISELHGNFLVNTGDATARDVFGLIEELQALVRDRFDVELAPEVKLWHADG